MSSKPYSRLDGFSASTGWADAERWVDVQKKYWFLEGAEGIKIRQEEYRPFFQRFGRDVLIDAGCRFSHPHRIVLDDGVRINRDATIEGSSAVRIGRNVRIGNRFYLHSANHDIDPNDPGAFFERGYSYKPVWIGDNVLISANVSVMPGARIENGSFVAAGAVVPGKKFAESSYLGGVPARPMAIVKQSEPCETRPAPAIAIITNQDSARKDGAKLLVATLGMPQVAIFTSEQTLPPSIKIAFCLEENCLPPADVNEVWQVAAGDCATEKDVETKISVANIGDIVLPKTIAYETVVNGFGLDPSLGNVTQAQMFRTSNAYLKGTEEMRRKARGAWALCLLAAKTSSKPDDPRWDQLFKRIESIEIHPKISLQTAQMSDENLQTVFKDAINGLVDTDRPISLRGRVKTIVFDGLKRTRSRKRLRSFFTQPEEAFFPDIRKIFIENPWLLPAFVWFNDKKYKNLCAALINMLTPHMNTSQRLACLGLSHRLRGEINTADNVLATLLSLEWIAPNAALVRTKPDTQAIDRHPALVAFLVDQFIMKEETGAMLDMSCAPIEFVWEGFGNAEPQGGQRKSSLAFYDLKSRKLSKSLFDNWLKLQELPDTENGHFYLKDWNYHRPCQALEAVWRELFADALNRNGLPAIRIKPWPSGYDWAISIRYDVDRAMFSNAVANIIRIQKEQLNAGCGSWYFLENVAHNAKTAGMLRGWNQEHAHHARHRNEKAAHHKGVTAHSAADSEYWCGGHTISGLEISGALYGEAMLSGFPLPRPGWLGDKITDIWLTPLHYPLEGSTKETTVDYFDQRLASFRQQIASGGLVIIGSHPDCNQDILDEVLERENLEKVWAVPVVQAVERVKALYSVGNITVQVSCENVNAIHLLSTHTLADVVVEVRQQGNNSKWKEQTLQFQAGIGRMVVLNGEEKLNHNS